MIEKEKLIKKIAMIEKKWKKKKRSCKNKQK